LVFLKELEEQVDGGGADFPAALPEAGGSVRLKVPVKGGKAELPGNLAAFLTHPVAHLAGSADHSSTRRGARPAEMERLQWRDIDLEEGMIDLPAKITKRGRRRGIPIEPALKAWLQKHIELCRLQQGPVCKWGTVQPRRSREKLRRRAGIPWQQNWARGFRSFAIFRTMAYLKAAHLKLNLPTLKPT
jgi:integrase